MAQRDSEITAVAADGAGITAFRGEMSLQLAPLLNGVVRRLRYATT